MRLCITKSSQSGRPENGVCPVQPHDVPHTRKRKREGTRQKYSIPKCAKMKHFLFNSLSGSTRTDYFWDCSQIHCDSLLWLHHHKRHRCHRHPLLRRRASVASARRKMLMTWRLATYMLSVIRLPFDHEAMGFPYGYLHESAQHFMIRDFTMEQWGSFGIPARTCLAFHGTNHECPA